VKNSKFQKYVSLTQEQWDKLNSLISANNQALKNKKKEGVSKSTEKLINEQLEINKKIWEETSWTD
jgi:Spy/CpxP family protein refolding chaperone